RGPPAPSRRRRGRRSPPGRRWPPVRPTPSGLRCRTCPTPAAGRRATPGPARRGERRRGSSRRGRHARKHRACTLPFRSDAREHGPLRDKHALGREALVALFFLAFAITATRPLAALGRTHVRGQLDVLVDLWTVHWLATH